MTKADLVEIVYEKIGGLSKSQDIVEAIFETMKSSLKQGEKIKISGFGNFTLRDKRPRKGRNPQTGDDIQITARRVLTFRPSQILKTHINVDVEKPT
jgi:integration host factor subunit alpha